MSGWRLRSISTYVTILIDSFSLQKLLYEKLCFAKDQYTFPHITTVCSLTRGVDSHILIHIFHTLTQITHTLHMFMNTK